ncbi:BLUF domain-containing protein [Sphingomonas sp. RHCKR47]|uniref:BLUF domain-containing protein n=1 Tax=Sphingomonas citricola TaxID=2862498 RepID=UPI001C66F7B8|nr:BLUF domain-containing protein [Sphingomonas citricola]MBW6522512.1 BLUF domain-containing protein [Sphingomonas citricola]
MYRVIYVSRSLIGGQQGTLTSIVQAAAGRNRSATIAGMLWSDDHTFVQALEGEEAAVMITMPRILADHRHTDVEMVETRPIQAPRFGAWSMIKAGESALGDECGLFLVALAGMTDTPARRRMREVMMRSLH